jgi:hypothetical protein
MQSGIDAQLHVPVIAAGDSGAFVRSNLRTRHTLQDDVGRFGVVSSLMMARPPHTVVRVLMHAAGSVREMSSVFAGSMLSCTLRSDRHHSH